MAIDETGVVDAIGVDGVSGKLVMSIADHLDWKEERLHLEALRDKFNAYLHAIQSGDLVNSYPDAEGRSVVIELVTRVALPDVGLKFLEHVEQTAKQLDVEVRARTGTV
jgi:hypothetical protein